MRMESASGGRLPDSGTQHVVSESTREIARRAEIDGATDERGELPFDGGDPDQADAAAGEELDEDIDVTVGSKIGTERRPEDGKRGDAMTLTECGQRQSVA
jgi:hypothetical protein